MTMLDNASATPSPYRYYDTIQKVIDEICFLHNEFSLSWRTLLEQPLNLKKNTVRSVTALSEEQEMFTVDKGFFTEIREYTDKLTELTFQTDLEYTYKELDLRMRVKNPESIVYKLKYYRIGKKDAGRFPINKCLNDLMGFRIVVEQFDHTCNEFEKMIKNLINAYDDSPYKIRKTNASKNEYKATHIYIHGEKNTFFPWELQIWNLNDVNNNMQSHEKHKQNYVEWTKIYNHSSETFERSD